MPSQLVEAVCRWDFSRFLWPLLNFDADVSSDAIAQRCIDPPTTVNGKCSKQAGATCDPVSRRWINGSKRAYDACMAAAGAKPTYNDSYKNIQR